MGNATVTDELGELYRLDARESEPEDEPAGGQDSGDGNEAGGAEPDGMPHPVEPEGMPHPVEPEGMPHP